MIPRIKRINKRLSLGRPVESVKLRLIHTRVLGEPVTFCVNMKNDPIQRNHRRGQFYEMSELSRLRRIFPEGGVFADIGANVGNHTLFAAKFLKASKVIPFEPNPRAFDLLLQNVLVNGLGDVVDLSKLGVGVSDAHSGGFAMQDRERNLGGATMLEGEGDLEVFPGHELLSDVTPDFIKIDVEGMEMKVLSGLEPVLKRCRPILMVEVDNTAEDEFMTWVEAQGYAVLSTHQRYRLNKNHLVCDAGQLETLKAAYFVEDAAKPEEETA
ncbi:FkbM family methyltransferase [Primorskyibacter aestuariivivens]|uniref:FkbM family methyltransferase n=1 Tax=Primorskyibacter aestuariivivens TaxID=1888912 RepID=UPI002300DF90|nr:FkbM family methyltransferase [Primorskyibacter aestuariivivens]MDA7428832.1 FkbM family methyltransferase [Primorskyibacter aestuariivivens]